MIATARTSRYRAPRPTEDTILSDNVSDFCIAHSDDPAIAKHINMRFRAPQAAQDPRNIGDDYPQN